MKAFIKRAGLVFALVLASAVGTPEIAEARSGYQVVDLGTLTGYSSSTAYAINDAGQIAGISYDPWPGAWRATIWNPVGTTWVPQDVGTLPGWPSSFATDISGTGLVVAIADTPTGMTTRRGFVWSGGEPVALTTDPSEAWGVNFSGTRVAGFTRTDTSHHAVVWSLAGSSWVITALPELTDTAVSEAMSVSDTDVVVGNSSTSTRVFSPLVWVKDTMDTWTVTQLPSLAGATVTLATRIDRRTGTRISGESGSALLRHGVLWTRTGVGGAWAIRDLGALPRDCCSDGADVNASGQVTGNSQALGAAGHPDSRTTTPYVWTPTNGMRALGSLAGRSWAAGINSAGLVTGSSDVTRVATVIHAVVWVK